MAVLKCRKELYVTDMLSCEEKDYYKYHGQKILILPDQAVQRPDLRFIQWHNEHVYKG